MNYSEAFKALGYTLSSPRQDWSADSPNGVCISLWAKELSARNGLLWMDTRLHGGALENWHSKVGNQKRIQHLRNALDNFGGRVDVVIVSGQPGKSYGTAQPWLAIESRSGTRWEVTNLEEATGHFEICLRRE